MLFDDLLSANPADKLKNYEAFNDPSNMFTKEVNIDDFTTSNRSDLEDEILKKLEDKERRALASAARKNEELALQFQGFNAKPKNLPVLPTMTNPNTKPIIDLAKYDTDKTAKVIMSEIDNSSYDLADKQYLKLLGARESDFRMNAGKNSYKGLYQFHADTLKGIGLNMDDYLKDSAVQHKAALKYRDANLKELKDYQKYIGTSKDGIPVTKNGLGAMAHLLGATTVKDYFDGTKRSKLAQNGFKDGNGTHISEYLKMFAF